MDSTRMPRVELDESCPARGELVERFNRFQSRKTHIAFGDFTQNLIETEAHYAKGHPVKSKNFRAQFLADLIAKGCEVFNWPNPLN